MAETVYPLKVGHLMTSSTKRHGLRSFSRPGHVIDLRSHGLKEVRKSPPEKARGRRCPICRATIEVMQDRPHLGALLRQSPLIVVHLSQRAVAAFDGGGGPLKGLHLPGGPGIPSPQSLRGKAPGERMRGKCAADPLQGLLHLGFPPSAARAGPLRLPGDFGPQSLLRPRPPEAGDSRGLQVLPPPYPPQVHERRQGRQLFFDLVPSRLTIRQLLGVGERFHRFSLCVPPVCHRRGCLGSGVVDRKRMQRQGEGVEPLPILALEPCPASSFRLAHLPLLSHLALEMRLPLQCLGLLESVFGLLSLPACLLQLPAKGQGITCHNVVYEVKHLRDTQARQSLVSELEERLGPLTAQGAHWRS
jgi:hypothetical protein